MPVIGRGDDNDVEGLIIKSLSHIADELGAIAELLFKLSNPILPNRLVNITNVLDVTSASLGKSTDKVITATAYAADHHIKLVVGRSSSGGCMGLYRIGSNTVPGSKGRGRDGRVAQETSSCEMGHG